MVHIPKRMNNEESRLVAAVVVTECDFLIAEAYHSIAMKQLRKYYERNENA